MITGVFDTKGEECLVAASVKIKIREVAPRHGFQSWPGCKHAALVPHLKRAKLAVAAGADERIVIISAGLSHNRVNLNRSTSESLLDLESTFELARDNNLSVAGADTFDTAPGGIGGCPQRPPGGRQPGRRGRGLPARGYGC
jgi:hypothetical protein